MLVEKNIATFIAQAYRKLGSEAGGDRRHLFSSIENLHARVS